jgi:hypothetical protein
VLSRPEVRLRYDTLRSKYLGVAGPYGSLNRSSGASTGYEPFVPVGFTTQRDNFGRVQREAGATAQDTRERMRVERFRNLPLSEKKVIRYIDYVLTLTQTDSCFCSFSCIVRDLLLRWLQAYCSPCPSPHFWRTAHTSGQRKIQGQIDRHPFCITTKGGNIKADVLHHRSVLIRLHLCG